VGGAATNSTFLKQCSDKWPGSPPGMPAPALSAPSPPAPSSRAAPVRRFLQSATCSGNWAERNKRRNRSSKRIDLEAKQTGSSTALALHCVVEIKGHAYMLSCCGFKYASCKNTQQTRTHNHAHTHAHTKAHEFICTTTHTQHTHNTYIHSYTHSTLSLSLTHTHTRTHTTHTHTHNEQQQQQQW